MMNSAQYNFASTPIAIQHNAGEPLHHHLDRIGVEDVPSLSIK